jgi:hypothetical protein
VTLLPPDPRDTDPKVPDDWDDVWTVAYFDGYGAGYLEGRSFVPPFGFARHRPGLIPLFLSAIAGAIMASLVWAAVTHAGPVGPPQPEPSFAPVPTMPGEVRSVPSAPAVLATPRPTPIPVARGHVRTGVASFMAPKYGRYYLALPNGRGHRVTICGPAACVTRVSTDAGPDLAMQRAGRVADVSFWDFATICGCDPWARGLVRVTVTW